MGVEVRRPQAVSGRSGHVTSGRWRPTSIALVGLASIAAWVLATNWTLDNVPYDVAGGLVLGPFLLGGALVWASRVGRRDGLLAPWMLPTAVLARLAGSITFLVVNTTFYEGFADAFGYARLGAELSERVAQGLVLGLTPEDLGGFALHGTGTIIIVTAALFALVGRSALAGFLVFALAGLVGHWLLYRAYRLAEPDGNARLYGLLVLFFPGLVFWTSPIGKEAWFALFLGVGAYGLARVLTGRRSGYPLIALGLLAMAAVRPHVAAMFAIAVAIGLVRGRLGRRGFRRPSGAIVAMLVGLAAVAGTIWATATFFGIEELQAERVLASLQRTTHVSSIGGSEFEAVGVSSLKDLPAGAAAVLFRPFPTEAENPMMILAAAEGVVLMGLLLLTLRRPSRILTVVRGRPYLWSAVAFTLVFVAAFSYVGNFGILVRQRTMMLPFLFAIVASVHRGRTSRPRAASAEAGAAGDRASRGPSVDGTGR